ncbi:hypothetical protein, partial [Serratia proteamaculans]|uniref:hypothetical protein n=1 Tax=Serratia proteamaculans TaxID=28151 RepID=UPI001A91A44F
RKLKRAFCFSGILLKAYRPVNTPHLPLLSALSPHRTPDHEYGSCGNEIKSLSLIQWLWHKLCNVNLLTT